MLNTIVFVSFDFLSKITAFSFDVKFRLLW